MAKATEGLVRIVRGASPEAGVDGEMTAPTLRRKLHRELDPRAREEPGLSLINRLLVLLILCAVVSAVLQTEPLVVHGRETAFRVVELVFGTFFAVEYLLRLWTCPEDPRFAGRWGRLRFAVTPMAIVDLLTVLASFAPVQAGGFLTLRLLRAVGMVRFAGLGRFSSQAQHLFHAITERRYELGFTVALAMVLIVLGASAMWAVEGVVQPDKFGSIPRAMWWAAVTLTTIGYGDVFPVTPLGKLIAVLVAISGIGLIAMPTGILAAAFSDALQRSRAPRAAQREP